MNSLEIDIETYSSVDLKKCGVYKYAESPDFALLLFGYSIDGGEVQAVDTANGEAIPQEILNALQDDSVIKSAHNASFERICLSRYLGVKYLSPKSWRCTMVWSAYLGLPLSLAQVGEVLGLGKQKLTEGKELIRLFCIPDKDGNRPTCNGEKWQRFKAYNKRDVETEMEIQQKLSRFPVPDFIWEEYILDQQINDRGIGVDMEFVEAALELDAQAKATLSAEMCRLTGVENPNSVYQLLEWLESQGYSSDSLDKKNVIELMKTAKEPVRTVLALRQQLAKSSVKKYQAMQKVACADGRARGCFQFYGANRTGRFCLAEGTPIMVKGSNGDIYEKPIEDVTNDDLVWDGVQWVEHDGVVFSGEHDVITWDGITATPEHQVFIDEHIKIPLVEAKELKLKLWTGKPISFTK